MQQLNRTPVKFDAESHTYTAPDGRQLSGVTAILNRQLFAYKYLSIPEATLRAAAERGSNIHQRVEVHDSLGTPAGDDPYLQAYDRIKAANGLTPIANEYLVSDGDYVASSIDAVYEGNHLCDIKTTSSFDREYVSWQLSIYAWLFEQQNPGQRVGRLFGIWLPLPQYGKPRLIEVTRKPAEEVAKLIAADKAGEQYYPPITRTESAVAIPQDAVEEVIRMEQELKALQERRDTLKAGLLAMMQEAGISKAEIAGLRLTVKAAYERQWIDAKKLKEFYPEAYNECAKTTTIKESLIIKPL